MPCPDISIIVPVRNAEPTILPCLESLMNLDYCPDHLEIIVVDNNSTDRSREIIKEIAGQGRARFPVTYLFEEYTSTGAAKNRGLAKASGRLAAFLSADCVADKNWISELVRGFNNGEDESSIEIGGLGGRILPYSCATWVDRYLGYSQKNETTIMRSEYSLPWIIGANSVFPAKVLRKIGGFDRLTGSCEDVDISWRIQLAGCRIGYVPKAVVYHNHDNSLRAFLRRFFRAGYDYPYFAGKYKKIINSSLGEVFFQHMMMYFRAVRLFNMFSVLEILRAFSFLSGEICYFSDFRRFHRAGPAGVPVFNYKGITWWRHSGKITLFNPGDSSFWELNGSAGRVWEGLIAGEDTENIARKMCREYNHAPEEIKRDITEFSRQICESKLCDTLV